MTTKGAKDSTDAIPDTGQVLGRRTILASDVGLSLTLSDQARQDFERIQQETIRAAEKNQDFSWR